MLSILLNYPLYLCTTWSVQIDNVRCLVYKTLHNREGDMSAAVEAVPPEVWQARDLALGKFNQVYAAGSFLLLFYYFIYFLKGTIYFERCV